MSAPELSTTGLITACLAPDSAAAWREFVARFQPLIASVILRTIRRYGRQDPALADDLVQETFVRLCKDNGRALRDFEDRHESAIFGYLKVVAGSVALDHFRSYNAQKRLGDRLAEPESAIDQYVSTPAAAHQEVVLQEIDRCVARITDNDRDRTIFWLYYQQGFTASDIAKLAGISLSAKGVESCLLRLTKAVRKEIAGEPRPIAPVNEGDWPRNPLGEMR